MPFYAAGFFVYGIILGINQISLRSQFATSNLKYDFANIREKRRELYFNENKTENSSYCLKNLSFRSWAKRDRNFCEKQFFLKSHCILLLFQSKFLLFPLKMYF